MVAGSEGRGGLVPGSEGRWGRCRVVRGGGGWCRRVDGRAEVVEHLGDEDEDRGVELREGGVA